MTFGSFLVDRSRQQSNASQRARPPQSSSHYVFSGGFKTGGASLTAAVEWRKEQATAQSLEREAIKCVADFMRM